MNAGEGCRAEAPQGRRRTSAEAAAASASMVRGNCYRVRTSSPGSPPIQWLRLGIAFAVNGPMANLKRFVHVLKNVDRDPRFYVGVTSDVDARLMDHNAGRSPHTVSGRPWQRHVVIEFSNEKSAICFERYLKSGSGRAFAKRHLDDG